MNELFKKDLPDSDSNDDEYIPNKKELEQSNEKSISKISQKKSDQIKSKVDKIWEKLKQSRPNNNNNNLNDKNTLINNLNKNLPIIEKDDKKIEEEIQEAIKKSKEIKNKTKTETYYFAGEKYEETKEITDKEKEKIKKKQTHHGLDQLIEEINKKKNISTIDKSKKDWKDFVEKENIEKELINNRKDGFLGKKKFLDESNLIVNEQKKIDIKKAKYAYENKINNNK